MAIVSLACRGFRNLKSEPLAFDSSLTAFLGNNGQGKTNLLEAIYFLATSKSFRRAQASDMVTCGEKSLEVSGMVRSGKITNRLSVRYGPDGIARYKNQKKVTPEEYLAVLKTVAISSSQMAIIHGPPEERRRFLDRGIMSLNPSYLKVLSRFNRARRQRNAALQTVQNATRPSEDKKVLEAWNEEFIRAGAAVMETRNAYSDRLKKKPERFFRRSRETKERLNASINLRSGRTAPILSAPCRKESNRGSRTKFVEGAPFQVLTGTTWRLN